MNKIINDYWLQYKNSPEKSQTLKDEIFQKAQENPSGMWSVYFRAEPSMCVQFDLLETRNLALKSKQDYDVESSDVLVKVIAQLAHVSCRNQEDFNPDTTLNKHKVEIWQEVFQDVPNFTHHFNKIHLKFSERSKKITSKFIHLKLVDVLEVIELKVPYKFTLEDQSPSQILPKDLLEDMKNHYNEFRLDSYMDLPFKTQNTKMDFNDDEFIFQFDVVSPISDSDRPIFMEQLQKKLKGQLNSGWGCSWSQQGRLVGNHVIYSGFDTENISLVEKPMSLKPKF